MSSVFGPIRTTQIEIVVSTYKLKSRSRWHCSRITNGPCPLVTSDINNNTTGEFLLFDVYRLVDSNARRRRFRQSFVYLSASALTLSALVPARRVEGELVAEEQDPALGLVRLLEQFFCDGEGVQVADVVHDKDPERARKVLPNVRLRPRVSGTI